VNDREITPYQRIAELESENAALQEKVDDWENATLGALDHSSDEQHCTCVPLLVGKVKQLERENAALRADKERLDWLAVSDKWFEVPATESFTPDTFRAAIDAARKEQP